MGYLDKDGLAHLWGKITDYVAQNGGGGGPVDWENINGRPDLSGVSSMKVAQIVLLAVGWASDNTQTVDVIGILADENQQLIIPIPKLESKSAYTSTGIECVSQAADSLTFQCTSVPAEDIRVNVFVFGAAEVGEEYTFEWWSPQMTSYTTPAPYEVSPKIGTPMGNIGGSAWNAFQGDDGKGWFQQYYDVDTLYIQFDAGFSILVRGISFNGFLYSGDIYAPASFKLKASNDGINWDLLAEIDSEHILETQEFMFQNNAKYRYFRLTDIARYSDWGSNAICNIKFYVFRKKEATS